MEKIVTCFLIDDDAEEHEIFSAALSDLPFRVTCEYFTTCSGASRQLENKAVYPPDFVFVDWSLSDMEGRDCISDMRQISKLQTAKMYIYSGMQDQGSLAQFLDDQNFRFLAKQNAITDLTRELETIFRSTF